MEMPVGPNEWGQWAMTPQLTKEELQRFSAKLLEKALTDDAQAEALNISRAAGVDVGLLMPRLQRSFLAHVFAFTRITEAIRQDRPVPVEYALLVGVRAIFMATHLTGQHYEEERLV